MADEPIIGHSVGERPTNPLIYEGDKWVYYISNVEEEQPPVMEGEETPSTEQHWRFVIDEIVPMTEHLKREEEKHRLYKELTDEAILAVDELACINSERIDALEAGGVE